MTTLAGILEVNWIILYFVYGQAFFILGLVTGLLWQRRSRLELARSLPWLTAFGIAHGLNEWGYIFIPLQALYLQPLVVRVMMLAHLLLLAVSFFFLFQFGIELLSPLFPGHRWLRAVPIGALFLWASAVFIRAALVREPIEVLMAIGDGWSRYLLSFPGSVLVNLGLLRQARQVREMGLPRIAVYLVGAAAAFAIYSLFGGLLVPTSPIWPANLFNYDWLNRTVHIPPPVFRSICGLAMAFFVSRSLGVFQVETDRLIEEMEREYILTADRERIGRELHDGIIQNIYAAGLGLEDALHLVTEDANSARQRLRGVMEGLNQTIRDIRGYILDLQAAEQTRELEKVLENLVHDLRRDTRLKVELEIVGQRCCRLNSQLSAHLVQIAREALSNVVRHAQASRTVVCLQYEGEQIRLAVTDDGTGMPAEIIAGQSEPGHGIPNMQARARLMGSELVLQSTPGRGTRIEVTVECSEEEAV